jgi:hypothetical protein
LKLWHWIEQARGGRPQSVGLPLRGRAEARVPSPQPSPRGRGGESLAPSLGDGRGGGSLPPPLGEGRGGGSSCCRSTSRTRGRIAGLRSARPSHPSTSTAGARHQHRARPAGFS